MSSRLYAGLLVLVGAAALVLFVELLDPWNSPPRSPIGPPVHEVPGAIEESPQPVSSRYLGHRRELVIERFGVPSCQWEGHYGNPPRSYLRRFNPAVTLTYETKAGTLYLTFTPENDEWVCCSSDWLPKGWEF